MKFRSSAGTRERWLCVVALLVFAALAVAIPGVFTVVAASTRPHVGGTLRIELRERVPTLDPRERPAEAEVARAQEILDALVFDRLLRLDDHGDPAPALAMTWQSENAGKHWRFELRPGVQFSDGTPLTADTAAAALAPELLLKLGDHAHIWSAAQSLTIETEQPMPDLPQQLATGGNFIYHVAADGKSLAGTGPFVIDHWDSGASPQQDVFSANTNCWAGRPFVDRLAISLGVESPRIEADLEFGLTDAGELAPAEMRRAAEHGVRTWSSEPVDLFVLAFDPERPAVQNGRLRQAIATAIDRNAIANVVLQHQAVPAGALLPEWISGYAFLFPAGSQVPSPSPAAVVKPPAPLVLVYDSQDAEARAVAERVIVDLRAAGIAAEALARGISSAGSASADDVRLVRVPIAQPAPAAALDLVLAALSMPASPALGAPSSTTPAPAIISESDDPESLYAAERAALADFRVVPLAHASENWGLGATVRDWMAARWGDLRLEDVWLDLPPVANPQ
ncbi:MAG: ABC transporter substrate-binding protein [Candidatus Acidiferrales bacterium]